MTRATPDALGDGCLRNGRTFLALAGLAEERGEFGHAYSLTILAWEETAKCLLYRMIETGLMSFEMDPSKSSALILVDRHILSDHREKHTVVGCTLFGMQIMKSFGGLAGARQPTEAERQPGALAAVTPEQVAAVMPPGVRPDELASLPQRVEADPDLVRAVRGLAGEAKSWNTARNRGFYVDDREHGMESPWDVTAAEYRRLKSIFDEWRDFNGALLEGIPTSVRELIQRTFPILYAPPKVPRKTIWCSRCTRENAQKSRGSRL